MVAFANINVPGSVGVDFLSGSKDGLSLERSLPAATQAPSETNSSSYLEYRSSYFESTEYRGHKVFKRAIYANETIRQFRSAADFTNVQTTNLDSTPYSLARQSPAQTANNILGFIDKRLQKEATAGASKEDLSSLLQQARIGIDKGFEQARGDLEGLELLTPELSSEIDQSYDLALKGLEALKVKYGVSDAPQSVAAAPIGPVSQQVAPAQVAPLDDSRSEPPETEKSRLKLRPQAVPSNKIIEASSFSYQSGMRGSLMITTKDGDRVYLDETLIDVFKQKSITGSGGSYSEFVSASQFTQELKVIGSLDEEEIAAIQDLVEKASDIADLMQGRDFQAAMESALALDFDESELAGFALQLTRVEVFSSASVVYKKPSPMNAFGSAFSALSDKISGSVSLLNQLKVSNQDYAEFISQLAAKNHRNAELPSRHFQAFQSMTQELLKLHRDYVQPPSA